MTLPDLERKPETMGRRLASLRALRGLSQREVAERAECTQAYLSQLENDKAIVPPVQTIAKLAELYGATIDYVVRGNVEDAA